MSSQTTTVSATAERPLAEATSFIETQFPVAKVSIESYKERKAVRYALTENPVTGRANPEAVVPEYFRAAESGSLFEMASNVED